MLNEHEDLAGAEQRIEDAYRGHLRELLALCNDIFDLIGASLTEVIGDDPSTGRRARRVAIILLTRVANDLRVASRVARMGYALQSASVVAGLYEIALTSIHVGTSEELALKWTEHRKPLKAPWSVATLTRSVAAKAVPADPDVASRLYQRYTQLCWAKHGHPMSEIHQVSRRADDAMEIVQGPDDSDVSLRTAWFALAHAAGLALLAQSFFVLEHISPGSRRDALLAIRKRLDESQMKLLRQGAERWAGVDPFPGQWATL